MPHLQMKRRKKMAGRHYGMQAVTLCISTTMVLILLGLVLLSVQATRNLSTYVKENMSVNLVLGDTVTADAGRTLVKELEERPFTRQIKYISQEEALATMTTELGDDPVKFAGVNPFQAEIEIQLKADFANGDSLDHITTEMIQDARVIDVIYAKDQIDAVDRNVQRVNIFLLVLVALHIFICFTLISNTVQLGVYSRRFTIHTMKLVGAKWSFIRHPFLVSSITIGLIASVLACLVLGAGVYSFFHYQPELAEFIGHWELGVTAVSIFIFGFFIMLLCTLLSVNRFLRMTAGELYKK